MVNKLIAAIVIAFLNISMIHAQVTVSGSSAPGAMIDDDAYDGTLGTMTCDIINISGLTTATDVSVDLNISHTWVGDLVIKLVAPDNSVIGLQSRAGFADTADDGTGCCGDSSDLDAANTENYADPNPTSAEMMGSTIAGGDIVCLDDMLCDYFPFPESVIGATTLAAFASAVAAPSGDWMLCIGDSAGGDIGEFSAWSLSVTGEEEEVELVPTMGEWGVIVLFLLILIIGTIALSQKENTIEGVTA